MLGRRLGSRERSLKGLCTGQVIQTTKNTQNTGHPSDLRCQEIMHVRLGRPLQSQNHQDAQVPPSFQADEVTGMGGGPSPAGGRQGEYNRQQSLGNAEPVARLCRMLGCLTVCYNSRFFISRKGTRAAGVSEVKEGPDYSISGTMGTRGRSTQLWAWNRRVVQRWAGQ